MASHGAAAPTRWSTEDSCSRGAARRVGIASALRAGGRGRAVVRRPVLDRRHRSTSPATGYRRSSKIEMRMVTPAKACSTRSAERRGAQGGRELGSREGRGRRRAVPCVRRGRHHAPARASADFLAGRHDVEGGDGHWHADPTASLRQPARSSRGHMAAIPLRSGISRPATSRS